MWLHWLKVPNLLGTQAVNDLIMKQPMWLLVHFRLYGVIWLLRGWSATLLMVVFINVTLLFSWPEVGQCQVCVCVCVYTFSARASSSVPSAVSVFEVSVCKDLTLSLRPPSCFSLSLSWSCRFSIYRKKQEIKSKTMLFTEHNSLFLIKEWHVGNGKGSQTQGQLGTRAQRKPNICRQTANITAHFKRLSCISLIKNQKRQYI